MTTKLQAFKEAIADTSLGMLINIPINFIMVSLAFHFSWGAVTTTALMTTAFTVLAIVRKMYVRLHFSKRYQPKNSPKGTENA